LFHPFFQGAQAIFSVWSLPDDSLYLSLLFFSLSKPRGISKYLNSYIAIRTQTLNSELRSLADDQNVTKSKNKTRSYD